MRKRLKIGWNMPRYWAPLLQSLSCHLKQDLISLGNCLLNNTWSHLLSLQLMSRNSSGLIYTVCNSSQVRNPTPWTEHLLIWRDWPTEVLSGQICCLCPGALMFKLKKLVASIFCATDATPLHVRCQTTWFNVFPLQVLAMPWASGWSWGGWSRNPAGNSIRSRRLDEKITWQSHVSRVVGACLKVMC